MKKITGIFLVAVLCLTAGFAQQSMASISTTGQFGNDVDMFMDVNAWQQVNPEKFFLYGGFGEDGNSKIELGFAKKFSPLYFGTYLKGEFPSFIFRKTGTTKTRKSIDTLSGSLLFGFGNIGIKAHIEYNPVDHRYTYTPATNMQKWDSNYNLVTNLDFGINLGESQVYAVAAGIYLSSNVDKTTEKQDNKLTAWTNNSNYILDLYGSVETNYAQNDGITKTWGVVAKINTTVYPKKTAYEALTSAYDKKGGEFAFGLTITPKWALKYETEDKKFAIKFTTKADADITYGAGKNYTVSASGTKTYEANRDKSASFSVAPTFDLGLVFSPKPGTINLNAGVGLTTPSFKVDSITNQTRNTTDGTVTSSVNETKTTLKGEFKSDIAVGFTWFITKNVMFDASWNILDQFTFGVNNALGTKIAFLLSVKM